MVTLVILCIIFLILVSLGLLFLLAVVVCGGRDDVDGDTLWVGILLSIFLFAGAYGTAEAIDNRVCKLGYYECVEK